MARKQSQDLFDVLRGHGLRKRVARTLADLESGGRRTGSRGEKLARQTANDLTAAAEDIRRRLLGGSDRSTAANKAAATRKRNAAKRSAAAKKGARTRAKAKH
jgi:hypothetical protein